MLVGKVEKSQYAPQGYALGQDGETMLCMDDNEESIHWLRNDENATPVRVRMRVTVVKDQSNLEADDA
jgi:hypothetical protein